MKNTTEKFHKKKYIKYQTEARPREAEARPSHLNCLEAASSRGRCLEDSIMPITQVDWEKSRNFWHENA